MQDTISTLNGQRIGKEVPQRPDPVRSGASNPWYNSHNPLSQKLTVYQREVQLSSNWTPPKGNKLPKRRKNDIQEFSRKSRLRLLRKFNRLQTAKLSPPIFLTLTARKGSLDPKKFRDKFLKTFLADLREIIPKLCYTWRVEPHKTGYPHIHMFIWSELREFNINSTFYWKQIRYLWREAISDQSRAAQLHSCKIKRVNDFRKATSYVAKYLAKEDTFQCPQLTGRRWGCSTNFPDSPITEVWLSPEQADDFRNLALALINTRLKAQGKPDFDPDPDSNIWIWMDPPEIEAVLRMFSKNAEASRYRRVVNKGDPDISVDDLAQYQDYLT